MDQTTTLSAYDRRRAAERLAEFIVQSIEERARSKNHSSISNLIGCFPTTSTRRFWL